MRSIQLRDIPNLICVARIILVLPIVMLLVAENYLMAVVLFAVAGISDGIDGYLARRYSWQSWWGSVLDPLADKILLVACCVTLGFMSLLPLWLVLIIVLRDVVIITGAYVYHLRISGYVAEPSMLSKANTFVQIVLVLAVIANAGFWSIPSLLISILIGLVLLTTVLSGIDYVWRWSHRAINDDTTKK